MQIQGGGSSGEIYRVGETRIGPADTGREGAPPIPPGPGKITPASVMATRAEEKQMQSTFKECTKPPTQQSHRMVIGMMAIGGFTGPEIQELSKPVHDRVIHELKKD